MDHLVAICWSTSDSIHTVQLDLAPCSTVQCVALDANQFVKWVTSPFGTVFLPLELSEPIVPSILDQDLIAVHFPTECVHFKARI